MLVNEAPFLALAALLGDDLESLMVQFAGQGQQLLSMFDQINSADLATLESIGEQLHTFKGSALSLHCLALVTQCENLSGTVTSLMQNSMSGDNFATLLSMEPELRQCIEQSISELERLAQRC